MSKRTRWVCRFCPFVVKGNLSKVSPNDDQTWHLHLMTFNVLKAFEVWRDNDNSLRFVFKKCFLLTKESPHFLLRGWQSGRVLVSQEVSTHTFLNPDTNVLYRYYTNTIYVYHSTYPIVYKYIYYHLLSLHLIFFLHLPRDVRSSFSLQPMGLSTRGLEIQCQRERDQRPVLCHWYYEAFFLAVKFKPRCQSEKEDQVQ